MAKHYGIPYLGSKDKIAPELIRQLPSGERFVDLFGGGFAMSHAALLSKKWNKVYYNEINKILVDLIADAISGKFNYNVFKPEFITREQFEKRKEQDGYIKYIWSFSNSGKSYLFSDEVVEIKRQGHNYCVFGIPFDGFPVVGNDPRARRINLRRMAGERVKQKIKKHPELKSQKRKLEARYELQQLERLERLQQLERLEQLEPLERIERLELNCGDYKDYQYTDGDVVYCDPPYEDTATYSDAGFDHAEFYEWAATRPYKVFFSSFQQISDDRFKMIYAKRKRNLNNGARNLLYNFECLYTNDK